MLLLLAVRTRQREVRRKTRSPTAGVRCGTLAQVLLLAAFDSSIMPASSAQQSAHASTTDVDMIPSLMPEQISAFAGKLQNTIVDSMGSTSVKFGSHPSTQDILGIHFVIPTHVARGPNVIAQSMLPLPRISSIQSLDGAGAPAFDLRAGAALERTVSRDASIVRKTLTGVVGMAHVIVDFICIPLFIGCPVSHDAVLIERCDHVVLIPAFTRAHQNE